LIAGTLFREPPTGKGSRKTNCSRAQKEGKLINHAIAGKISNRIKKKGGESLYRLEKGGGLLKKRPKNQVETLPIKKKVLRLTGRLMLPASPKKKTLEN